MKVYCRLLLFHLVDRIYTVKTSSKLQLSSSEPTIGGVMTDFCVSVLLQFVTVL